MPTSSERRRAFTGPIVFSHGFRPFFLVAGIWAALALLIWTVTLATGNDVPSQITGADWHMHEMVFGYTSAVIAGFLLTAVPNWTGRLPVVGWPVAGLTGIWVAGRLALYTSEYLPVFLAPLIDISFLLVLGIVIAREVISGKNWRNIKVLVIVLLLALANIVFHIEAANGSAYSGYGVRLGIGTIIFLITLIGGRVIPSFTRNWMVRSGIQKLPTPMNRFDSIALAFGGMAIVAWVIMPEFTIVRLLNLIAGGLHLVRVARWSGWRTLAEPLVMILHVTYVFIPIGFLMLALGDLVPGWSGSLQIPHAWMVGAIGGMTLAMMTRVSLGHSGRILQSSRAIVAIYLAFLVAAVFRIASEMFVAADYLLYISATGWILAFAGFVVVYFPILTQPKK